MNLKEKVDSIIRYEENESRRKLYKNISKIIKENILYYYPCCGSGYYLRYKGISGYNLTFFICNKQGKIKKDKIFTICWYFYDTIEPLKKITDY